MMNLIGTVLGNSPGEHARVLGDMLGNSAREQC